jgi:hypothetical protein
MKETAFKEVEAIIVAATSCLFKKIFEIGNVCILC